MVLAPFWLKHKKYREYYAVQRQRGVFIVLDNGEYEGQQVPMSDYIEIGRELLPNLIVAPDQLGDMHTTLLRLRKFVEKWQTLSNVQGVVQGRNLFDRLFCYREMRGLPAVAFPRSLKAGRLVLINQLKDLGLWDREHLIFTPLSAALGWTGSLHEVRCLAQGKFHMLDTSAPAWRGLNGYHLYNKGWPDYPFDPMYDKVLAAYDEIALANLTQMEASCKSTSGIQSSSEIESLLSPVSTTTKL